MTTNQSLLLKSSDAASRLGVSTSTLHRWVRSGKIECNTVYFMAEALDDFVQKYCKQYQPKNRA